ncbi:hypothetical protein KIW84_055237 [Lathyrus oleraceus]|uniref:Uncharacterized protein n=1 Tax=Pisum sativum TaxID=3888 RepID=A0A9D4WY64_PEA|nr:hypothetical protein KIW84_055237 [Pisum sativum]
MHDLLISKLWYPKCYGVEIPNERLSCFATKALVNVGSDMAKLVPGRVSTEVDARLAYDTHGIIWKVHDLLKLYNDSNVPHEPAAQAGASVIQIFVGRVRDWARTHSDDEEIEAAQLRGEDPWWGPQLEQTTYKNRQRLYPSEQTDDSVPNTLVIANCEVMKTRVAAAEHIP